MRASSALAEGLRRAARAPAVVAGTFALTLCVALPLSIALRAMLTAYFADSGAAGAAVSGTDYSWWQEFLAQATGLGTTFVPSVIGFGAVLQNVSGILDNVPVATTVAGAVGAWLLVWSFLSGGIIDRLARDRPTRSAGFFAACGAHFPALLRLAAIALVVYAAIFRWLQPMLLGWLYGRLTLDTSVERTAFLIRVLLYAVFGAALIAVNLVLDYARIRIVVEDRRSAIGSVIGGLRFVRRHAGTVGALYLLNGVLFVALASLYAAVARGASPAGAAAWLLFAAGEIYILARHYLKMAFYASETALFQSRLAHAAYTAAPPVEWPESPAAESIANAGSRS